MLISHCNPKKNAVGKIALSALKRFFLATKYFICASRHVFPANIRNYLSSQGYHLLHTADHHEAVKWAKKRKPHCVVFDYHHLNYFSNGGNASLPQSSFRAILLQSTQLQQISPYLKKAVVHDYILKPVNKGQLSCLICKAEQQRAAKDVVASLSLEELVEEKLLHVLRRLDVTTLDNLHQLIMPRLERPLLKMVLDKSNWNQVQGAKVLGINRNTLRKKLAQFKLAPRTRSKAV